MKYFIGIELGSTRIKSVLTDEKANVLAKGKYEWNNTCSDGLWTYDLDDVWKGLHASYADLVKNFGKPLGKVDGIGISGMMHGYLAFDKDDNLLAPFRTWRNTNTGMAAGKLSELFRFNIPMRWSVSHYYQAILDGEEHVGKVSFLTTLAGYVHYKLTGKKVLGIGDASGMFPVTDGKYDCEMLSKFNELIGKDFEKMLPEILVAGEEAGKLTEEGALLLDESGTLQAGCPLCPPEGDMGTGVVCTNCVSPRMANASLGTSANLTVILEKPLQNYYPEIDIIQTPDGNPAAIIHTNTCTSVLDSWVDLFREVAELSGGNPDRAEMFDKLLGKAAESDPDVGKVVGYNYLAGEPIARTVSGVPSVFMLPGGRLNLANFMQMQVYSAIAVISLGMDILEKEKIAIDTVYGHGGYFKTPYIGQSALSALVKAPASVMENAGEGGAWGIALLAIYASSGEKSLPKFLDGVFSENKKTVVMATKEEISRFEAFMSGYKTALSAEKNICDTCKNG